MQEAPQNTVTELAPSKTAATCGRVVLMFSTAWEGPRPGLVIRGEGDVSSQNRDFRVDGQHITANVMVDGANDTALLALLRQRPGGNTFTTIPLFDPLDDAARSQLAESMPAGHALGEGVNGKPVVVWAEWMPYQKGQAQKTDELTPRVAAIEEHLKNTTAFGK